MSIEVWKFIVKQADILKNKRLAEMKALAENDATEEISGLTNYKVAIKPYYLLNGVLVVKIEATRKIMLGYLTRSISGGFEISVDGEISDYERPIKTTERTSVREHWEAMANS